MNDAASDLELLRCYEPVVKYTAGEHFYPCAVEGYLQRATLWQMEGGSRRRQVVDRGWITTELLGDVPDAPAGSSYYLRLCEQPLGPRELHVWRAKHEHRLFSAPGRFSRVGLVSRVASSLFNLSLLVRGKVPGGTAAAVEEVYEEMRAEDPRYVYYGRVLRSGGYTILHYLFFFAMNDWRSSFYGLNDHEADWEQCFVYLVEGQSGQLEPRWVAFASHDYRGDDLRRRWDDPDLTLVDGRHPVIYAGAGSHASYFLRGEYITGVEPKFFAELRKGVVWARKFWVEKLSQGNQQPIDVEEEVGEYFKYFKIAFVDYARGDGVAIGPGQAAGWSPVLMDGQEWIENYRGLWGVDTEDPFGGERAPAGPKYNRDGSVRLAWYDPLAWAGLDKVAPPAAAAAMLERRIADLAAERARLVQSSAEQRDRLRQLALEAGALGSSAYTQPASKTTAGELAQAQQTLQEQSARLVIVDEAHQACLRQQERIARGDWGPPQAHLRHQHRPEPVRPRQSRLLDWWSAVSGAALLAVLLLLLIYFPRHWYVWVVVAVLVFFGIEAGLRNRLASYLLNVIIFLALVTTAILLITYWRVALVLAVATIVFIITRDNLRELAGR